MTLPSSVRVRDRDVVDRARRAGHAAERQLHAERRRRDDDRVARRPQLAEALERRRHLVDVPRVEQAVPRRAPDSPSCSIRSRRNTSPI